ncbi:MAG: glycosyl hydrolase family 18 protein [Gemmatimonadota bacterium]|nr:glycosyl hydrolase family 18 protein [Gemmatimonadota bacterium]
MRHFPRSLRQASSGLRAGLTGALLGALAGWTGPVEAVAGQEREVLFYMGGSGERALETLRAHADRISIVSPQAFRTDSLGDVEGGVHPEVMAVAAEHGIDVIPLIVNPGFDQPLMHALLANPAARRRTIDSFVRLAREHGFRGWQFDYENFHVDDRDAFTAYYRETADAFREAGLSLSVAVVPTDGSPGTTSFQQYMQDNWRNGFDVAALAEIGDFVSLMTYAQHGGPTAPGPVAGLPWVRRMLDYALAQGVPASKISLGIPTYSATWRPVHDEGAGARVRGFEIPHERARELLDASGATPIWLPEIGVAYAFWSNEGIYEWLFLEDARSLEAKLDLLDEYEGLRGISAWVLGAEDPEIWEVLARRVPPTRGMK